MEGNSSWVTNFLWGWKGDIYTLYNIYLLGPYTLPCFSFLKNVLKLCLFWHLGEQGQDLGSENVDSRWKHEDGLFSLLWIFSFLWLFSLLELFSFFISHKLVPLALDANLASRWRHLHWLQIWSPGGATLSTSLSSTPIANSTIISLSIISRQSHISKVFIKNLHHYVGHLVNLHVTTS